MTHDRTYLRDLLGLKIWGLAILLSVFTLAGGSAAAAELKSNIVVDAEVVTLGDLLDGLEDNPDAAEKVVAKAPAPGTRGRIHVASISSAARVAGVAWRPDVQNSRITVERAGLNISLRDLEAIIGDAIKRDYGIDSFRLSLSIRGRGLYIPTANTMSDIRVDDLQLDTRTDRYAVRLSLPAGGGEWSPLNLQGRLERITHVPTLARAVAAGDTIGAQDIHWVEVTQRTIGYNTLRESKQVVGMTPRRNITPGRPIRNSDLERPTLVRKNSLVALSYQIGNLRISAVGRALDRGGRDDIIRVLNRASNKTVEARVTAADTAEVLTPGRLAVASNNY